MQVLQKIDQLISDLNKLKPLLTDDKNSDSDQFSELLKVSLETKLIDGSTSKQSNVSDYKENASQIPDWVNPNYAYASENPRKPNMRELMEAISGKTIEDLYAEPNGNWKVVSRNASEMLYGVMGSNKDTRDWPAIMASDDILLAAKAETGKMYEPKVSIHSNFDEDGLIIEQIALVKDKNENTLRTVPIDTYLAEETLRNFGATQAAIPTDLEEKIVKDKFDKDLLNFLKNFDKNSVSIEKVALQTATDAISKRLSDKIPLEDLAKL